MKPPTLLGALFYYFYGVMFIFKPQNRPSLFVFLLTCFSYVLAYSQGNTDQESYDVKFYHLNVSLTDTSTYISACVRIDIKMNNTSDMVYFNLGNRLNPKQVRVNGVEESFSHFNEKLKIYSNQFLKDSIVSVYVCYSGNANERNTLGAVINEEKPPYGRFTYTLAEPFSSKYWFPCKEVLSDKADSVFVYITVPKNLKAGSNGLLKKIIPIDENHVQFQWESRYPTAFYLVSVAIGNYKDYSFIADVGKVEMPVVNYIFNSQPYFEKQKSNIDTTVFLLNYFSELFGAYPFIKEKYGHCLIPFGGGMEHQTMTSIGSFDFELLAHELAHQWFGNSVTCSAWNYIWINEGFASYAEYLAYAAIGDQVKANDWMLSAQQIAKNNISQSIYVPDKELDDMYRIFDYGLTYKKGAVIIHMLRYEVNDDDLFFKVLKEFQKRYSYGVASVDDFKNVLEELTNRDFTQFFDQWYYGVGYPVIGVEWSQSDGVLTIKNKQFAIGDSVDLFYDMRLEYKLMYSKGDTIVQSVINGKSSITQLNISESINEVVVDPKNYLLKEVKFIRRISEDEAVW